MGRGLGKGMREFKDSISGTHEPRHELDHASVELPVAPVHEAERHEAA